MRRLANKNILITGGNSGIGLAAEFDREGARVAIWRGLGHFGRGRRSAVAERRGHPTARRLP